MTIIQNRKWKKRIEEVTEVIKDHIILGITDSGEILLLPKPEVNVAYNIGIYGRKQSGKTIILTAITSRMVRNWGIRAFFANDNFPMMFYHRHPEISKTFCKLLKYVNQEPEGLPLALCYPSIYNLEMLNYHPQLKLSIPISEFIERPERFIGKKTLGGSEKYFKELKEEFHNASTLEDIEKIIKIKIGLQEIPKPSGVKILSLFRDMISQKIFDMDNPETSSTVMMKTEEGATIDIDPIVALLIKNLIPVLITSHLKKSPLLPAIYNYYIGQIFDAKFTLHHPIAKESVYCIVDELNELATNDPEDITTKWVRLGGNRNTGIIWACQEYHTISEGIRNNTSYGLVFSQFEKNADLIASDFSLKPHYKTIMKKLHTFEFLAITKESFLLFDPYNLQISKITDPTKCRLIPPLSMHRPDTWDRDYIPPKLECIYPTDIFVQNQPFYIPYDMKKYEKTGNFPSFYRGQNLLKQFWPDISKTIKDVNLEEIERKGWMVLQLALEGGTYGYYLEEADEKYPISARQIDEIPSDLKIQLDVESKMIRLYGKKAIIFNKDNDSYFYGFGSWYPLNK